MNMYEVFTDGASRNNPGPSSCAYVIFCNGKMMEEKAEYLGISTNNRAEYMGVIRALERLVEIKANHIIIYTDSELVIKQINREYKVHQAELKSLFQKVQSMLINLFPIQFQHIRREKNTQADFLCNQMLDQIENEEMRRPTIGN